VVPQTGLFSGQSGKSEPSRGGRCCPNICHDSPHFDGAVPCPLAARGATLHNGCYRNCKTLMGQTLTSGPLYHEPVGTTVSSLEAEKWDFGLIQASAENSGSGIFEPKSEEYRPCVCGCNLHWSGQDCRRWYLVQTTL